MHSSMTISQLISGSIAYNYAKEELRCTFHRVKGNPGAFHLRAAESELALIIELSQIKASQLISHAFTSVNVGMQTQHAEQV